jgi:hypothetical protein
VRHPLDAAVAEEREAVDASEDADTEDDGGESMSRLQYDDYGWLAVLGTVLVVECYAPPRKMLSHGAARYRRARPAMTISETGYRASLKRLAAASFVTMTFGTNPSDRGHFRIYRDRSTLHPFRNPGQRRSVAVIWIDPTNPG